MRSRNLWNGGIVLLLIVLLGLLLQFLLATLRIRELAHSPETGASGGKPPKQIVLIGQVEDNPFWRTIERGAREAAASYGMSFDYRGPLRINPQEQIRLLEKALAARPDAVLVQGINSAEHRALIDRAAGEGIPVIAVDADEPGSRRLAYIGTDNRKAGETMGELVARQTGGRGRIGVLIGTQAYSQQLRLEGFQTVAARYPGLQIAGVRSTEPSRLQAAQQAEELLSAHPDIGYIVGFSALDGLGALNAAERTRPQGGLGIFAFDDLAETKEAILGCRITATLVQQPYRMGYDAVTLLRDYWEGRMPASEHFTAAEVYTRDTDAAEQAGRSSGGGACP
ncbi:substrate-binding domain-containing protein [Paenibacillus caseinilyticus]|uniref:LacI family transcriptional regulator n=1 Tax=Paenibacillus mucilaginosus K02 TaxID=997761 RepID=I0BBS4_9BACL|nr:substrate-binding domain-containing protein [Paenibacillus mucilaginosus]AFH59821.1 LacI family transcriptional regulator [Paenibacillus mucilaginosus K02]